MQLYFVRHGESEANILDVVSNRGWKHGLTERGRQQAAALAEQLQPFDVARIYTSPLRRAAETADILAARLGVECVRCDALREHDCGDLEGQAGEIATAGYTWMRSEWFVAQRPHSRLPGGESLLDLRQRLAVLLQRLAARQDLHGRAVALVGHGGLYQCGLPGLLHNLSYAQAVAQPFPNAGYVLAQSDMLAQSDVLVESGDAHNGAPTWYCRTWCGVALEAQPAL